MANIQQSSVRYQKNPDERCQTSSLTPNGPSQGIAGQSDEERSEWRPETYYRVVSGHVSYLGQTGGQRVARVVIDDCGESFPLVIADLGQRFVAQATRYHGCVDEEIRPWLEDNATFNRAGRRNKILRPTGCCNKAHNYRPAALNAESGSRC